MPRPSMLVRLDPDQVDWLRGVSADTGVPQAGLVRRGLRLAMVDWSFLDAEAVAAIRGWVNASQQ